MGRIDAFGKWEAIKQQWLNLYQNKKEMAGFSVMHCVKHTDEWCAEAYMEMDYSKLQDADFERKIKEYVAFKYLNNID